MTYVPFDPATDNPEKRIQREPHDTKVDTHEFVKAVDTTERKIDKEVLQEQPMPHGTGAEIAPLVIKDIEARIRIGEEQYGERLKAFNGRSSLQDAYEEALDLAIYLRQAIEERINTTPLVERVAKEINRICSNALPVPSLLLGISHDYKISRAELHARIKEIVGLGGDDADETTDMAGKETS